MISSISEQPLSIIRPLQIGSSHFDNNLIQGPLAGISCSAFRTMFQHFSPPAYTCTEMISAYDLVTRRQQQTRYTHIDPLEGPVCFQLSATDPMVLAEATKRVTALGASIIDLNCGCPKPKIRSKGAGSKLLSQHQHLFKLVNAMRNNTHLPISIKIRVDGNSDDQNNLLVARIAEEAGADCLIVHGRHWQDDYTVACHLDQIAEIVKAVSIPVIANGDMNNYQDIKQIFTQLGCAGFMISRAGVGQPWLFAEIQNQAQQQIWQNVSWQKIATLFIEHIERLAQLESEFQAILQARRLGKYYTRNMPQQACFLQNLYQCQSISQLQKIIGNHFPITS